MREEVAATERNGNEGQGARDWKTLAAQIFVILALAAGVWLALRLAVTVFLPFLIAAGLAALIRPTAEKLSKKLRLPGRLCAAILTLLSLGVVILLLILAVDRVSSELQRLFVRLGENGGEIGEKFAERLSSLLEKIASLGDRLPFPDGEAGGGRDLREPIAEALNRLIADGVGRLGTFLSDGITRCIAVLPSFFLGTVALVLSCFYFVLDDGRVGRFLCGLLPERWRGELPRMRGRAASMAWKYLRAYLLIMGVTFVEVFVGLSLLRVEYAFLLALIVAVVDLLPVLGSGTVLIPWGIVLLIGGNYYRGIGILILCAVVVLCREILEPRVVGESLGLHPLAMLAAVYVGVKIFGVAGFLIGPAVALVLRIVWEKGTRERKEDPF